MQFLTSLSEGRLTVVHSDLLKMESVVCLWFPSEVRTVELSALLSLLFALDDRSLAKEVFVCSSELFLEPSLLFVGSFR